ncbi:MAG: hypothetical protein J6T10_10785 [Methanobrevibacter sp.]|nr:hypothetical protein [Methanobrevibacter sp.]
MRFDSFKSLVSFLGVLGNLGYQVPFKDYEKDFKDKGFDKHIHNYKFTLEVVNPTTLLLSTVNMYHDTYMILMEIDKKTLLNKILILLKELKSYTDTDNEYNRLVLELMKKGGIYTHGTKE